MALVGSIRVGTISGLVNSVKRTKVRASLTLRAGEDEGQITFREGELESCAMDVLEGGDALDEMLNWTHGQFTLRIIDAGSTPEDLTARGPHVMVVDDELGVRKLIESFLEAEGYRVSVVSQASQALNLVEYCRPDVLLLDVMLTGIDGFELAELLSKQQDGRRMPILMMSANHDYRARSEALGMPFFGKPFDFKKLCQQIDELVGVPADRAVADRLRGSPGAQLARPAPGPGPGPAPQLAQPGQGPAPQLTQPGQGPAPQLARPGQGPAPQLARPGQGPAPQLARPGQGPAPQLASLTLPAQLASILDAESFLPGLDQCFTLDEMARARVALAQPDPSLAALLAGFDGFQTLGQYLAEDPESREQRVLITLLLFAVDALHRADAG